MSICRRRGERRVPQFVLLLLLLTIPSSLLEAQQADEGPARLIEEVNEPAKDEPAKDDARPAEQALDDDEMLEAPVEDDVPQDDFDERFVWPRRGGALTVDQWVFGGKAPEPVEVAHTRFEGIVQEQMEKFSGFCELNEDQVRKLLLAARGDVDHLYRRVREHGESCRWSPGEKVEIEQYNQASDTARELRKLVEAGPFGPESLYQKTIRKTLTPRQFAMYSALREIRGVGGRVRRPKGKTSGPLEIDLRGTAISNDALRQVASLTSADWLNLEATNVSDTGLQPLWGLSNLRRLDLANTDITDAGLTRLYSFPELESLDVGSTKVTDAVLGQVGERTGLRNLRLFGTRVTDAGLKHLQALNRLENLNLSQTQITDEGLAVVGNLTRLNELGLFGTRVTDAGLVHLQNLSNLEVLDLKFTRVSDVGVSRLKQLTSLQEIYLFETQVTDSAVAELEAALPRLRVIR